MTDIPGITLAATVPRVAWHKDSNWQVQTQDGLLAATKTEPYISTDPGINQHGNYVSEASWAVRRPDTVIEGPISAPPADWTSTLRRIVDHELDERERIHATISQETSA